MPTILCPHCTRPAVLPDPWPHRSYTCPHCGATVSLAAPPPPPPPAFPPAPVPLHHTNANPVATGFGNAFGGVIGCFSGCVVIVVALAVLAGLGPCSNSSPTPAGATNRSR